MYPPVNEQPVWGGYIPDPFQPVSLSFLGLRRPTIPCPTAEKDIEEVLSTSRLLRLTFLLPKKAALRRKKRPRRKKLRQSFRVQEED